MWGHRLWRWPRIKPALDQQIVVAGMRRYKQRTVVQIGLSESSQTGLVLNPGSPGDCETGLVI